MKKTTLIAVFVFLLSGSMFAQEGIKIGFRASPLVSWASVVNDSTKTKPDGLTTKPAVGFSFDFVLTYGFSESVAFRSGINIATKGYRTETTVDYSALGGSANTVLESKTNITSVEVPIGFKFRSPEIGSGMYIVGQFGVNAEINLANKVVYDQPTILYDSLGLPASVTIEEVEQRDVDGIRLFTTSFTPGVGMDWEFDWGMLEFMATYHWGLLSITNPDKFGGNVTKINYIALNLGYFF